MPALVVTDDAIIKIGNTLCDVDKPLKDRFRALFTLKNIGTETCIKQIGRCFTDKSSLLKHELAYCLGQMRNVCAIPILNDVLEDSTEEVIVRHEAGEALGAIGSHQSLPLLQSYIEHPIQELAETCQLAIERIDWLTKNNNKKDPLDCEYTSVDPAPPMKNDSSVNELNDILLNEGESLFVRYKAMFALRNKGGERAVLSLTKGLHCKSALFRHEIAFVLGQMADPISVAALKECLQNTQEKGMVRHECAEALGAIATEECLNVLKEYKNDEEDVVKESCDVALDMCDYENSQQFQYANALLSNES